MQLRRLRQMFGLLLMPITWLSSCLCRGRERETQAIADANEARRLQSAYWGD